jgi:hypothetical protein
MPELLIQALFPYQQRDADAAARYKLACWGRRRGKTRVGFHVAVMGHGPCGADGEPRWKGLRHGGDIIWIARSYRQAGMIWREEVRPRFVAAGGVCNDAEFRAQVPGMGSFMVCSQDTDSIANARGMGARLVGVIGDETAHWRDAEAVWLDVVAPMLMDNYAWAWFFSTPEPGSWFDAKCDDVAAGVASSDWYLSEGDARDNPRITAEAFASLVAEYPAGDPRLAKEVYADRKAAGKGWAFPEYDRGVHERHFEVPRGWRWVAGLDWGYASYATVEFLAVGPPRNGQTDPQVHHAYELTFHETPPEEVGEAVGAFVRDRAIPLEWIAGDDQMWQQQSGPVTIAEMVIRGLRAGYPSHPLALIEAPKGAGSRATRKMLTHAGLKHTVLPDGTCPPWGRPSWTIDPVHCPMLAKHMPILRREIVRRGTVEVVLDQVMKDGKEHWWDAATYAHQARIPLTELPRQVLLRDQHPGMLPNGQRRKRNPTEDEALAESLVELSTHGVSIGGRYGGRRMYGL